MKLLGNSLIYTAVSILQKAIGFFLLPVYTAYLTPADYGVANVILSIVNFLSIFYLLALHGAGTRFEHQHRDDPAKAREIWGTLFLFVTGNAALLTVVMIAAGKPILAPFLGDIPFSPYMAIGLAAVAFSPSYVLFQSYLQSRQEGVRYGLNNLAFFLVNMVVTLVLLAVFRMKAEAILLALAVTNAAFFAYTLWDFPRRTTLRLRGEHLKASFAYSLPLVPHSLASWAMGLVDRVLLNRFRDAAEVGVYSIGGQVGNIINILTGAVNQAFVPWFFQQFESGAEGKARIARISGALVSGYSACALAVSLFAPEVLSVLVTAEFREAWRVVPFIAFSFVFGGIYYVFVNPLFVRRTPLVPLVTLSSAALGVACNWILIPRFGMLGAAVSSLLSMAASSVVALALTLRFEPLDFPWIRIFAYAGVPFLLSLEVFLADALPALPLAALKACTLAGVLATLRACYREEVARSAGYLMARLSPRRPASPS